ncbi:MAG: transposase [Actinomycetota bacterium]|nr:transposase [Actinomycetota bacterium]
MAETPGRRRPPQKYPDELRERAVRMVFESIEAAGGKRFGVVTRVAKQLGIGTESVRQWVNQAEWTRDGAQGPRRPTPSASPSWSERCASCGGRTTILKAASLFFASSV